MKLSDEEERIVAAYEKRHAELEPIEQTEYMKALMKAAGIERLPTLRESFEEANALYAAGVCNVIKHPAVPMRCSECGKSWGVCECGRDVLRAFTCEKCGFRVMTGGKSLGELLSTDEIVS